MVLAGWRSRSGGRRRRHHRHGEHPAAAGARARPGPAVTPLRLVLALLLEVRVAIFYATLINIVAVVPVMLVGGRLARSSTARQPTGYVLASMPVADCHPGARPDPAGRRAWPRPTRRHRARAATPGAAAGAAPRWLVPCRPGRDRRAVVVYPRIGQTCSRLKEPTSQPLVTPDTCCPTWTARWPSAVSCLILRRGRCRQPYRHRLAGEEINRISESWLSLSPGADYPGPGRSGRSRHHPGAFSDVQTLPTMRIDEAHRRPTDDIMVRVYGSTSLLVAPGGYAAVLARVPGPTDVHPAALEFIPRSTSRPTGCRPLPWLTPGACTGRPRS